jgi:hypothetical protein
MVTSRHILRSEKKAMFITFHACTCSLVVQVSDVARRGWRHSPINDAAEHTTTDASLDAPPAHRRRTHLAVPCMASWLGRGLPSARSTRHRGDGSVCRWGAAQPHRHARAPPVGRSYARVQPHSALSKVFRCPPHKALLRLIIKPDLLLSHCTRSESQRLQAFHRCSQTLNCQGIA